MDEGMLGRGVDIRQAVLACSSYTWGMLYGGTYCQQRHFPSIDDGTLDGAGG